MVKIINVDDMTNPSDHPEKECRNTGLYSLYPTQGRPGKRKQECIIASNTFHSKSHGGAAFDKRKWGVGKEGGSKTLPSAEANNKQISMVISPNLYGGKVCQTIFTS